MRLTLLKLGAPSVCGASLTSLSMPSKWSVMGMHFCTFVILAAGGGAGPPAAGRMSRNRDVTIPVFLEPEPELESLIICQKFGKNRIQIRDIVIWVWSRIWNRNSPYGKIPKYQNPEPGPQVQTRNRNISSPQLGRVAVCKWNGGRRSKEEASRYDVRIGKGVMENCT